MTSALTTPIFSVLMQATLTKTASDGTVLVDSGKLQSNDVPSDGTIWFHNQYTIASGGNQSLDLSGALVDQFGDSAVFTKVYGFYVKNLSESGNNVLNVGNSNFAAWLGSATDYIVVQPKGILFLTGPVTGFTVTNSSADIFKIANPGASSIICNIGILGK